MDEETKVQVCRLCFNLISTKNFFQILGSVRDMLNTIVDLNLNLTDVPIMCNECLKSVQDFFNFKTNFFESEEQVESKVSNDGVKLNLMNNRPKRKLTSVKLRYKICRTCLKEVNGDSFIPLVKDADVSLSFMLDSCLSELDLSLTVDPVMCMVCYETLKKMSIFKTMCKMNENKIESYLNAQGARCTKNVDLHCVVHFTQTKVELKDEYQEQSNCMEYVRVKIEPADERNETVETTMRDNSLLSTAEDEAGVEVKDKTNLVKTNKIGPNKTDRRKHGESITRCPECDFSTKYKYNLRRHLIVAHDRKDIELTRKAYKCTECDFATRWNLDLTRHMLSHVKPEAFRCTRCPYSTDENSHLVKHILSHLNNDDADKYSFLQTTRGGKKGKKKKV